MGRYPALFIFCYCASVVMGGNANAQVKPVEKDTFFLAKQKGLLGRIGKSLSREPEPEPPVKIAVPFEKYSGRPIRSVEVIPLAFNQNMDDTTIKKENLAIRVAKKLHVNTRTSIIRNYLFFKEGDRVLPLLISDNESFLRNQPFIKDALILVDDSDAKDSVDIIVITRDVFSIGGSINANSRSVRSEIREENLGGSGSQLSVSGIYDMDRKPRLGSGAEFIIRNIKGSFVNWTAGLNSFYTAFNSERYEESRYYTLIEKPLVNRYTQWTAAIEASSNNTKNAYVSDSLYKSDYEYKFSKAGVWAGYNIGYKSQKGKDSDKRLRHFVAASTFYHHFEKVPMIYDTVYNYRFANINGVLFSYSLFKQNFYRTNFIYAFGRNEDIPTGLSASLIAGWTNKADRRRPYYGIEFEGNRFSKRGVFSSYIVRAGGYSYQGKLQDINLLLSANYFSSLHKLSEKWRNRNFLSFSYTKQLNFSLNSPLFLRSDFGLPYFSNGLVAADERTTVRFETDFYNLNKLLGFRFGPFLFTDFCFLRPVNQPTSKTDGYSALGGGVRARNENLVFETIELKAYYFPRTIDGMKNFKIDLVTRVRFKFNSNFIRKPDFIMAN